MILDLKICRDCATAHGLEIEPKEWNKCEYCGEMKRFCGPVRGYVAKETEYMKYKAIAATTRKVKTWFGSSELTGRRNRQGFLL